MKLIAAKLTKIMKDCAYVQKTGVNEFHRYKYAKAAAILEKANDSMVENNVSSKVMPKLIDFRDVITAKGATEHLATIEITVTLIDNDSGESLDIVGMGSGQDSGDKAIMKAQTAALKYAWMMSLNISTGDDPEADDGPDKAAEKNAKPTAPPQTKSPPADPPAAPKEPTGISQQAKMMFALATKAKLSNADLKEYIKQTYGKDSSKDLTSQELSRIIDYLQAKTEEKK